MKLPKWFPEEHFLPHGVSTPTGKAGRHQWRRVLKITVFRQRPDQELGHTDTAKVNFDVPAIFDPGTAISWILVTTDRILLLTTKVALGIALSECRNHVQTFACPTSAEGAHCVGFGGKIVASLWHDKVGRHLSQNFGKF